MLAADGTVVTGTTGVAVCIAASKLTAPGGASRAALAVLAVPSSVPSCFDDEDSLFLPASAGTVNAVAPAAAASPTSGVVAWVVAVPAAGAVGDVVAGGKVVDAAAPAASVGTGVTGAVFDVPVFFALPSTAATGEAAPVRLASCAGKTSCPVGRVGAVSEGAVTSMAAFGGPSSTAAFGGAPSIELALPCAEPVPAPFAPTPPDAVPLASMPDAASAFASAAAAVSSAEAEIAPAAAGDFAAAPSAVFGAEPGAPVDGVGVSAFGPDADAAPARVSDVVAPVVAFAAADTPPAFEAALSELAGSSASA